MQCQIWLTPLCFRIIMLQLNNWHQHNWNVMMLLWRRHRFLISIHTYSNFHWLLNLLCKSKKNDRQGHKIKYYLKVLMEISCSLECVAFFHFKISKHFLRYMGCFESYTFPNISKHKRFGDALVCMAQPPILDRSTL